ncbi:3-hydroxyacyl-CoA dehydrogenase family protein [Antarctobacter heliothermus]|uniref:3-hydroxyacyl-CoA dehydrogenase, C-terminal domain n=1 Tax=Antarctobacter heliothermus TaxID=74033 RepID=A0A239IKM6_9RHOB|nr:3-hydroxyacyl-CoA dehydrogenase family protein [Antarctobacter heliothermus]SNS93962.1 3-hydroxyacyl-CoA dehydrogenase, C-terminal domain [Antarctobacter heliothermus]
MADRLVDRLRGPFRDAAEAVFLHGSTPWEVDEALEDFGFAQGPFEAEDSLGLDLAWARQGADVSPILKRMMELGKLGRTAGAGWYRYPGGGGKVDDPIVADLALEEAHFHRLTRVDYGAEDIRDRLLAALVLAAVALVQEGAAEEEINRASVEGLGFPADQGGVLVWARTLGIAKLRAMVRSVRDEGRVPLVPARWLDDGRWPGEGAL